MYVSGMWVRVDCEWGVAEALCGAEVPVVVVEPGGEAERGAVAGEEAGSWGARDRGAICSSVGGVMTAAYLWMVVPAGLVGLLILAAVRMFRPELREWFGQERAKRELGRSARRERGPRWE